jgi:hypothetical protein
MVAKLPWLFVVASAVTSAAAMHGASGGNDNVELSLLGGLLAVAVILGGLLPVTRATPKGPNKTLMIIGAALVLWGLANFAWTKRNDDERQKRDQQQSSLRNEARRSIG